MNKNEKIRYGVIGTGMMGREHIANLEAIPRAEVVAIADPDPESLRLAGDLTGVAEEARFTDYRGLLQNAPVDAIVIATPNHTHGDVAVDTLTMTGSHVLIEKPLGITVAECNRIIEASKNREGITWMGLEYRYKPPITRLIEEVKKGVVGPVRMVAIREHRYPFLVKVKDWNRFNRNTGGTLVEKCCHFFDLMNLITGATPLRVFASGAQDVNHLDESYENEVPDIIDNAYVVVDYDDGSRAMLDLCMFAEASKNEQELAVTGDLGKIEAFVPEAIVRIGNRSTMAVEELEIHNDRIAFHGAHEGASFLEHLDFIAAIESDGEPAVTLEEGRMAVAIGQAGHLSIAEGRPVLLEEVLTN
jgi:predicted dehydrogenase